MKVYFYQSDIDAFSKYKDTLAEAAQRGDISFAYTGFQDLPGPRGRAAQDDRRVAGRADDFTVDEEMVVDKDLLSLSKTPTEAWIAGGNASSTTCLLLKADKAEEKADGKNETSPTARRPSSGFTGGIIVLPNPCTR